MHDGYSHRIANEERCGAVQREGATSQQLAQEYGVSFQTILRVLDRYGVQKRPTGRRKLLNVTHRVCYLCGVEKPIEKFGKKKKFAMGYDYECRDCHNQKARQKNIETNFGITMTEFGAMEKAQGGGCAICGRQERRTRRGRLARLAVDHDHETGEVRGLLCARCNAAIGLFDDELQILENAVEYLRKRRSTTI